MFVIDSNLDENSEETTLNTPNLIVSGHTSHVNTLCFDTEGTRMVSGDGIGVIKIWNISVETNSDICIECIGTINTDPFSVTNLWTLVKFNTENCHYFHSNTPKFSKSAHC